MRKIVSVVGNCLVGDALWCWGHFLPEPDTHKTALVIPYNRPSIEMLRDVAGLQVDEIEVHPDKNAHDPFGGLEGYVAWVRNNVHEAEGTEYRYFIPTHDLTVIPGKQRWRPSGCITVQMDSVHAWKRVSMIRDVNFPLPVKSITKKGEVTLEHTEVITDRTLSEVADIVLGADVHVGINSSITVLAMLLGVPTVLCNFGEVGDWINVPPYVKILIKPSGPDIESAIADLRCFSDAAGL